MWSLEKASSGGSWKNVGEFPHPINRATGWCDSVGWLTDWLMISLDGGSTLLIRVLILSSHSDCHK